MDKFPEWASNWLRDEPALVSHGLNLALPLKHPDRMPWLLWDIVVARPKIQRALDGLSFIHFARFVPSWDGTALMVTTEFDGPLEPYVMDFAIAIGDVFDLLLSYVADPPPLPVRDHPEAFWQFVQRWNRVPFTRRGPADATLLPKNYDYPLYSAYPQLSAIDIAGPRSPLPPALDRPAAQVDLADVQGNLLRGYGARAAVHLFFSVSDPVAARAWLSSTLTNPTSGDGQAWGGVMNACLWPLDADGKVSKPALMTNVAFTFSGLKALMPGRAAELDQHFPEAFRQGAEQRAAANGDLKQNDSDPSAWRFGRDAQRIHVVLMLHTFATPADAAGWQQFQQARAALQASAATGGLLFAGSHDGEALPDDKVYFGYRDGITQPRISGQCPVGRANFQPASSVGEFLLGEAYTDIYGGPSIGHMPRDLATNGSFAAMRLLEQDVEQFETMLAEQSGPLAITPDELKARLMGRYEDGTPLTLAASRPVPDARLDAFDYAPSWEHPGVAQDHDGGLCPVGAHIRRTNPRNARVAGQRHSRRLLRRGMPSHWDESGVVKKGLLGLFVCGSLERQFEFIQRQWIQGDLAASGIRGTQDPIAGLRSEPTDFHVGTGCLPARIPPLVRTRGCLYLFFPGIRALRGLSDATAVAADGWTERLASVLTALPRIPSTAFDGVLGPVGGYAAGAWDAIGRAVGSLTGKASSNDESPSVGKYWFNRFADLMDGAQPLLSAADDQWSQVERSLNQLAAALKLPDEAREMLLDLLVRGLDSAWFRRWLEHFVPPAPPSVQPPPGLVENIDPADPRFIVNPFDTYQRLRGAGRKLVWVPRHQAYWVLTDAESRKVFSAPDVFRQQPSTVGLRGIITLDNPRHAQVGTAVKAALDIAAERRKVDALVQRASRDALDRIGGLQQLDAVTLYAQPVPGQVFWNILGVPPSYREECASLAQTMMRHFGQPDRRNMGDRVVFADASLRLTTRLLVLLTQALAGSLLPDALNPYAGSLIGEMARRTRIGISLSPARVIDFTEALLTLLQFVLAGFMSMQFLMGTTLRNLLMPDPRGGGRPTPWQALVALRRTPAGPFEAALSGAIDESRRFDPPVTLVQRYAGPSGASLDGVTIPRDCPVYVVVASANRDGAPAAGLEQYWWDRTGAVPHLSLGHGIHECIGRALQDWVVPQAITALLDSMPNLQLCDTEPVPAWLDNLYFRALQSLPVQRCR